MLRKSIFILILSLGFIVDGRPSKQTKPYVRGCYYTNWSQYRPGLGKFVPENYQIGLCTHIFYAFAVMKDDFTLKPFEWNDEDNAGTPGMFSRVNALKQKQSDLKTLLSFGGYVFSQDHASQMRQMVSSAQNRKTFVDSAAAFVRRTGFDGFDIDWEYPDWGTKAGYAKLIQEMRERFENESISTGKPRLLLTAAVAAGIERISAGYNGKILANHFDFINVMTYDFHGGWESKTGFSSPLYDRDADHLSLSSAMSHWSKVQGVPKEKLIVGFGAYGRGWTTVSPASTAAVGSPTSGPSPAQPFTRENGIASYYEVCNLIKDSQYTSQFDAAQRVPYICKDNVWIGYDDVKSFNEKLDWLIDNGFGGAFVWSLDLDDFLGQCGSNAGTKYPLISAIQAKLIGEISEDQNANTTTQTPVPSASTTPSISQPSPTQSTSLENSLTPMPTVSSSTPFQCQEPGLYADPTSCTTFYQCDAAGIAHRMNCPAGLHFNKDAQACDWPNAAGCDVTKSSL